jgi:cysteine desulfurase
VLYDAAVRYLDHNATTPLDPRVRDVVIATLCDDGLQANPSSVHAAGQRARAVVERARRSVARAVGAEPLEVTFTAGGTEADNMAVLGAARALRAAGRACGLLTTAIEHPAVLAAAQALAREGHPLVLLAVDDRGRIDPAALTEALRARPDVGIVSLAAANHELGNAYDLKELSAAVRAARPGLLVHCDAVQALGKLPLDLRGMDVDLLSVSAHKIYGPKGVGALIHRRGLELAPTLFGGPQERGRRPGTESVAAIAGFGKAAELATSELTSRRAHTAGLVARLRTGLAGLPGARIHGDPARSTETTVNAGFAGCDGQLLLINLDLAGIAVSTGAACSSGTLEPSPVLRALGQPPEMAREALRISVGKDSSDDDVSALLAALPGILEQVRGAAIDPAGWREVELR